MMHGYDIICLGSASWNDLWVNAQHVMSRLSADNRILYIESTGMRLPAKSDLSKVWRRFSRLLHGAEQVNPNLWVIAPWTVPIYRFPAVKKLNDLILRYQIQAMLKRLGFTRPILWFFLPTGVGLIGCFNERLVVYHCVDDYSANPKVDREAIRSLESLLLSRADLVITTSVVLYEEKKRLTSRAVYMPNVADVEHFRKARAIVETPADLSQIKKPTIGYIGNISNYKFDVELLLYLADRHAKWSFVLIGPVGVGDPSTDIQPLRQAANVYLLGQKAYEELPAYLAGIDVAIIPFRINESTRSSYPLKFNEYLAAGKKIVSSRLPALEEYADLVYLAQTKEEFSASIERALQEEIPAGISLKREQTLQANSWTNRMEAISEVVLQQLLEKSSPTTGKHAQKISGNEELDGQL